MDLACEDEWTWHARMSGLGMQGSVDLACKDQWTWHARMSELGMRG